MSLSSTPRKRSSARKGPHTGQTSTFTQKSSTSALRASNGVTLYRGPSALDGSPIVAIATGIKRPSANAKTGAMVQVWILPDNGENPLESVRSGEDASVCGDCPLRGILGKKRTPRVSLFLTTSWGATQ